MSDQLNVKKINLLEVYRCSIIALGAAAFVFTLFKTDVAQLDFKYLFFVIITVGFASRIVVKIPKVKGHISVSDTFIFLSILLFGGEAGIILASIDAAAASHKVAKTRLTLFFNIAVFTLATFITVWILRFFYHSLQALTQKDFSSDCLYAYCIHCHSPDGYTAGWW